MRWIKYFEGYLDQPLYKEITQEESEDFTRESKRENIKSPIEKEDYVDIHRILYMLFDTYPNIWKIDRETKEDFRIEAKRNATYIYDESEPNVEELTNIIKLILDDGRMYIYIQMKNPYYRRITHDMNLHKIEGDIWILNFDCRKYYQLDGLVGLEDMIKNKEFDL